MSKGRVCKSCEGTGADNVSGFAGACDMCYGTGMILTRPREVGPMSKRFWKTTLVFEILTEGESALPCDMDLGEIVEMTINGDASGEIKSLDAVEVDSREMAMLLESQDCDPTLLLGEDVCTACWGAGEMGGAICAHCEEEDEAALGSGEFHGAPVSADFE